MNRFAAAFLVFTPRSATNRAKFGGRTTRRKRTSNDDDDDVDDDDDSTAAPNSGDEDEDEDDEDEDDATIQLLIRRLAVAMAGGRCCNDAATHVGANVVAYRVPVFAATALLVNLATTDNIGSILPLDCKQATRRRGAVGGLMMSSRRRGRRRTYLCVAM